MQIADYFGGEHRKIAHLLDIMLKESSSSGDARHAFGELQQVLGRHIYCEEELLFPEVEAHGLSGPTEVMRLEHGRIWNLMERIEQEFEKDSRSSLVDELRVALETHDVKEENVLYPAADAMVQAADALVEKARNAVPPNGWRCRALRTK